METPLTNLRKVICGNKPSSLFPNQNLMYQLLVSLPTGKLHGNSDDNFFVESIENLIENIKEYVKYMWHNGSPTQHLQEKPQFDFSSMHSCIYYNLTQEHIFNVDRYSGNLDILSSIYFEKQKSNITRVIANNRTMPRAWSKTLQNFKHDYSAIIYRFFWILQYYLVYYYSTDEKYCIRNHFIDQSRMRFPMIEYFSLSPGKAKDLFSTLKTYCKMHSGILQANDNASFDLVALSRVILDIIVAQCNISWDTSYEKIKEINIPQIVSDSTLPTELAQYNEFRLRVSGYGTNSFDRINILEKLAPNNCYAADELGDTYYWGKTFIINSNSKYTIGVDKNKAVNYYQMAINNSNPPLQSACYSLGYTLSNMKNVTESEKKELNKKALQFYKLAGEYPPSHNGIAKYLFEEANILYSNYLDNKNENDWELIIDKYSTAIQLAHNAGKNDYFYGYNQIAIFIQDKQEHKKLIDAVQAKVGSEIVLNAVDMLKKACEYNNPYAYTRLAKHYISHGKIRQAKLLLEKAMDSEYDKAFYLYAMLTDDKKERIALLENASNRGYPWATLELGRLRYEEGSDFDKEKYKEYIRKSYDQLMTGDRIDIDLLNTINERIHGLYS